jgi:hypothetical protein
LDELARERRRAKQIERLHDDSGAPDPHPDLPLPGQPLVGGFLPADEEGPESPAQLKAKRAKKLKTMRKKRVLSSSVRSGQSERLAAGSPAAS